MEFRAASRRTFFLWRKIVLGFILLKYMCIKYDCEEEVSKYNNYEASYFKNKNS